MTRFGMRVGTAWPRTAERMVMAMRAVKAAENTRKRGCFMAIRAAIKNVLSPISENIIMVKERAKEWSGCIRDPVVADNEGREDVNGLRISSGSFFATVGGTGGGIS